MLKEVVNCKVVIMPLKVFTLLYPSLNHGVYFGLVPQ